MSRNVISTQNWSSWYWSVTQCHSLYISDTINCPSSKSFPLWNLNIWRGSEKTERWLLYHTCLTPAFPHSQVAHVWTNRSLIFPHVFTMLGSCNSDLSLQIVWTMSFESSHNRCLMIFMTGWPLGLVWWLPRSKHWPRNPLCRLPGPPEPDREPSFSPRPAQKSCQ